MLIKISKFIATMLEFKAKMYKIQFRLGLRPRPRCGSLKRSPSGAGTIGARVGPCHPPLCESVGHGGHNRNIEKSRLICVDYVQI